MVPIHLSEWPDKTVKLRMDDDKSKEPIYSQNGLANSMKIKSYLPALAQTVFQHYFPDPLLFKEGTNLSNFTTQSTLAQPPPVGKLWAIYGVNLETEVTYYYKIKNDNFALDVRADKSSGVVSDFNPASLKIKGGVGYETPETEQVTGQHICGDGTVPYASLNYARVWKEMGEKGEADIEVQITEINKAEHRQMMKDVNVLNSIIDVVCCKKVRRVTLND